MSVLMGRLVRRRTAVLGVLLGAVFLGACGTTTQVTGLDGGPVGGGAAATAPELEALIAPAPQGFEPMGAPFGPIDLNRFLTSFAGGAPETDLAFIRAQFLRGLTRGWSNGTGTILSVAVFEFRDESGPRWFADNELAAPDQQTFPVAGVPGAYGTSYLGKAAGGPARYHQVFFARGSKLYLVFTAHPDPQASPDLVLEFAGIEAGVAR